MAPVFLKVYGAAGGDVAALVARHRLPADAAELREVDLSLDALDAIAESAAMQAKDPNLGMHLALRLPRGSYGLLEYIGRSATTVRQAGERFLRYSTLLKDLVTFRFHDLTLSQRVEGHPPSTATSRSISQRAARLLSETVTASGRGPACYTCR